MGKMNTKAADNIFEATCYLESLINWDDAMCVAHGSVEGTPITKEVSIHLAVLKKALYENEISEEARQEYDRRAKSMYYYFDKEITKKSSNMDK